jgi:hypothetical protein
MCEHNGNRADEADALVEALCHALSGSHGRIVNVEALRDLVTMEVLEWRACARQNGDSIARTEPLLASAWSLP